MKKILIFFILILILQTTKGYAAMENEVLFDKKINDSLQLQFVRNDKEKETITWQTCLINTKTGERLILDSYTLQKEIMYLGDPMSIASGEDMIFHHGLANAILIGHSLYVIHNMQGIIFLRRYEFTTLIDFRKDSFYLAQYLPVGALGHGYQYADFLLKGEDLYILVNADCEMASQNQRVDWLFRFDTNSSKLFSITFNSIERKDENALEIATSENPFASMDLLLEQNLYKIRNSLLIVVSKNRSKKIDSIEYWGSMENMISNMDFSSSVHLRTSGMIYFFLGFDVGQVKIARFLLSDLSNTWLMEDYIEKPLSGKVER